MAYFILLLAILALRITHFKSFFPFLILMIFLNSFSIIMKFAIFFLYISKVYSSMALYVIDSLSFYTLKKYQLIFIGLYHLQWFTKGSFESLKMIHFQIQSWCVSFYHSQYSFRKRSWHLYLLWLWIIKMLFLLKILLFYESSLHFLCSIWFKSYFCSINYLIV